MDKYDNYNENIDNDFNIIQIHAIEHFDVDFRANRIPPRHPLWQGNMTIKYVLRRTQLKYCDY